MRLLTSFFATCALFVASCVFAQTNPCPGEFGLSVEYLYMHPAIDQPYPILLLLRLDKVREIPSSVGATKTKSKGWEEASRGSPRWNRTAGRLCALALLPSFFG